MNKLEAQAARAERRRLYLKAIELAALNDDPGELSALAIRGTVVCGIIAWTFDLEQRTVAAAIRSARLYPRRRLRNGWLTPKSSGP